MKRSFCASVAIKIAKLCSTFNSAARGLSRVSPAAAVEFLWFIFIAVFFGQFGIFIPILRAVWTSSDVVKAFDEQAAAGNFLIFSTALVASSAYFLVRDYIRGKNSENRVGKTFWLLVASAVGLVSTLVISMSQAMEALSSTQSNLHWILYCASLLIAVRFWFYERSDDPAAIPKELEDGANSLTRQSRARTETSDGIRI